jgi:serine/threonine protein kinase
MADPERRRRFVQEARAASALDHPNIVTVHDIAESEGVHFIVMQFVSGSTSGFGSAYEAPGSPPVCHRESTHYDRKGRRTGLRCVA